MFNYLIKIEYDGTDFVGWQSQKNGNSIQDTIEKALKKIFKSKIRISGAGSWAVGQTGLVRESSLITVVSMLPLQCGKTAMRPSW